MTFDGIMVICDGDFLPFYFRTGKNIYSSTWELLSGTCTLLDYFHFMQLVFFYFLQVLTNALGFYKQNI